MGKLDCAYKLLKAVVALLESIDSCRGEMTLVVGGDDLRDTLSQLREDLEEVIDSGGL